MTATPNLPTPAPADPGSTVYVATDTHGERFIGVACTLDAAKTLAENDDEATPYFSEGMAWREATPLPPSPGEVYAHRHWIGSVYTEPRQLPREFRVTEHVVTD